MYMNHAYSRTDSTKASDIRAGSLDFLWLELTNRCNLHCVHCYTESHPRSGDRDVLTRRDYESLMIQARALGCRKIQFIGGEPQLNQDFQALLVQARMLGFEFIEVFSNLTRLDDQTVSYAAGNKICFATSVYSHEPAQHDAVTRVTSSHARTIANLKKLIGAGIQTRAAIIVIDQDRTTVDRTQMFLRDLGVAHVSHGEAREFGRGEVILARSAQLSGLCGHCWAGKLCVAPDGEAYPCVMARKWPVGNVLETPLRDIVRGKPLEYIRQTIFDAVWLAKGTAKRNASGKCAPENPTCGPDERLPEKSPANEPDEECPQSCVPDESTCGPECPQSCVPDESTCGPISCPQSCDPNLVE